MERNELWRKAFGGNLMLLDRNLPGLTDEMAAANPAPGVSAPAWVLGHITHARFGLMALIGSDPQPDPIWKSTYTRATDGHGSHLPFAGLVEAFKASDGPLAGAFQAVTDWEKPTLNPGLRVEQPLEQVVSFMYMHECYHLGQIGIFRKLLGLPGTM
jgi:uncharacterized damage-inducible protein DinB